MCGNTQKFPAEVLPSKRKKKSRSGQKQLFPAREKFRWAGTWRLRMASTIS